jgi:uncharacterized protein YndB with AHSA1/START domain
MADTQTPHAEQELELLLTRTFDAPRDLVYKAYTEAEHLAHWWAPKGFTVEVHHLDVRPGGIFHYCQRNEQMAMWGLFVYHDVSAPERLVFINSFSDPERHIVRSPFSATWPLEVMNVLELSEENGKTTITMHAGPHNATDEERKTFTESRPMLQGGFKGTLDLLEAYLATIKE